MIIMTNNTGGILCSTGTFIGRINDFDYKLIPAYSEKIYCDGFEMMIEPFWNEREILSEIADYLARCGLNFQTLHADKTVGDLISKNEPGDLEEALRRFDLNCFTAAKIGARLVVLHLWGGLASDKNIAINIAVFADLLEIARKHGVTVVVENVVCNTYNALAHLCELSKLYGDDAKFIIDVRHAEFHKMLQATCECGSLWKNVLHTHIADYKGDCLDWSKLRPVLRPGAGDVDFTYFFAFLKKIGYQGSFALEAGARTADGTAVDCDKLNESLDFIRQSMRDV